MTINTLRRRATAGALMAACLSPATEALATNGYFSNGYSPESKAMAGAGVAVGTGVMGLSQNPAMGTKIGNEAGFCLSLFAPDRGFTVTDVGGPGPLTTGTQTSRNTLFPVPCGGVNFRLNDRSSLGVIAYGNGGMNTEYGTNVFVPGFGVAGTSPLGVNLEQLFIAVNYAYQINDQISVGIAPVFAIQRFSATGLENFAPFSMDGASLTGNGDDWSTGGGLSLGMLFEPNENWSVGMSYRTRMRMKAFDKYAGLFAEQGDFDIPATASIGAAFTPPSNPRWTFTGEYQRIFYSDIAAIANSGAVMATPLGADDGPGFGWKDMDVVRLGAIYRYSDKLTLRGGVSYATKFIDTSEVMLNMLAPATPQWHYSIGATYQMNANWAMTTAFTHVPNATVSGIAPMTGGTQNIALRMDQNEFTVGFTRRW
ncbi:OmpP1/FadL family transporter [Thalassovita sp.]|uniref:OmpP1/FadL family transporter n=1 Tax=Thalassovita sp. TaxID=1979401 RepID=UPI0029DE8568|nr:outer membrane protein transport protein [Thalassovita sp.]